ncbi:Intraflagellar transport protein 22 [Thoreauomyces humboldtii]|nr:Intraflagellar transport protein 22 [Thoreauomyces humboldtii]
MAAKLTIFVVGPPRSGKTCISNSLAELSDSLNDRVYHPTQGVRILEFDRNLTVAGASVTVACEVWDCAGDPRFQPSWPALASTANAVLFVASQETRERDLDSWHGLFPALDIRQMTIFSHAYSGSGSGKQKYRGPGSTSPLAKIPIVQTTLDGDEGAEGVGKEFDAFLGAAYALWEEKREKEEERIMR